MSEGFTTRGERVSSYFSRSFWKCFCFAALVVVLLLMLLLLLFGLLVCLFGLLAVYSGAKGVLGQCVSLFVVCRLQGRKKGTKKYKKKTRGCLQNSRTRAC